MCVCVHARVRVCLYFQNTIVYFTDAYVAFVTIYIFIISSSIIQVQ